MNHKKSKLKLILIIPLVMASWVAAYSLASGPIITDGGLEAAIRLELNYEKGEIRPDQLVEIQSLRIRGAGIENIDGIQYMTSLVSLDLRDNEITDISLLAELTRLQELNLRGNQINTIEALAGLTSLRELNLRENQIADISPLAGLYLLEDVNLRYNRIANIEVLAELESLRERLYLEGNPIEDYSPIREILLQINDHDMDVEAEFLTYEPDFSHESGFYDEAFQVEVFSAFEDKTIYYTLNGSEPDPIHNSADTFVYEGPITVTDRAGDPNGISTIPGNFLDNHRAWKEPQQEIPKAVVIRAAAMDESGQFQSGVATHTYFVGKKHELPVISIATDPDHFFSEESGIYVPGVHYDPVEEEESPGTTGNFYERGPDWERPIHMEFFEADGTLGFSQGAGARIHGAFTRRFPQKTLRIYARNDYGDNRINYPLFGEGGGDEFRRFLLRQSGNDWGRTMFADGFMQSLIAHTDVETQNFRPAVVFLNGEYWGIHNIRERYDQQYFEMKYGVHPSDLVIMERNSVLDYGDPGDEVLYTEMLDFVVEEDMSISENYEQVKLQMDVENYITYQLAQIYFRNTDWPQNNIRYWRVKGELAPDAPAPYDGRWRWLLYDTDQGYAYYGDEAYLHNTLEHAVREDHWSTRLFRGLLENEEFRLAFINGMADHLNTTFVEERVLGFIDERQAEIEAEMRRHVVRWQYPRSIGDWHRRVNHLREFAELRPEEVRKHMVEYFSLSGVANVTVVLEDDMDGASGVEASVGSGGTVLINSVDVRDNVARFGSSLGINSVNNFWSTNFSGDRYDDTANNNNELLGNDGTASEWTGVYFHGVPVSIQAVPDEGYEFAGWRVGAERLGNSPVVEMSLDRDLKISPIFIKVD